MKEVIKEQLVRLFEKPEWKKEIEDFYPAWREDILWIVIDYIREGKYLNEAMAIAEVFVNDPNPTLEDRVSQEALKGEETRYIGTVRGTLAWLLNVMVGTLNAAYYKPVIDLLEKLCRDESLYVREQCTYALAGLVLNIKADKNPDGSIFAFDASDRERVINLAFEMLEKNRPYPRVMETLTNVFEKMRYLDEAKAMHVLTSFLYQPDGEYYPDYVTHNIAPLLIFFAEFRSESFTNFKLPPFDAKPFQALLEKVIKTAPPGLKTTITWHFWKTIENEAQTYPRFKKYIPLFFEGAFQDEPISQYEFLIEKVLLQSPEDAVWILKLEIEYLKRALVEKEAREDWTLWFHNPERIIQVVAENDPQSLPGILSVLRDISYRRGYIGDIPKVFASYRKAPVELQGELEKQIEPIYESLRQIIPTLPPL